MSVTLRWILGTVVALSAVLAEAKLQDCTQNCLVRISGIQPSYSEGSRSKVMIHNESEQDLDLNVAAEGFEAGSWIELTGSISDPPHAFTKTKTFRTVRAGSSLEFEFSPCDIQILDTNRAGTSKLSSLCSYAKLGQTVPSLFRLRVDLFNRTKGKIVQRVQSSEFRFVM